MSHKKDKKTSFALLFCASRALNCAFCVPSPFRCAKPGGGEYPVRQNLLKTPRAVLRLGIPRQRLLYTAALVAIYAIIASACVVSPHLSVAASSKNASFFASGRSTIGAGSRSRFASVEATPAGDLRNRFR